MKNFYINKNNIVRMQIGLLLMIGLGSCTVYSQGQQYPPNNTVYNQPAGYDNGNGNDDGYYDNSNEPEINFNNFYSALSPYGTWTNYGSYGQVWVCSDPGFRPYSSNGSWVSTNLGWSWNSGYSWGWAPFHYGRWGFAANIGWYWVPGYQWAPAWVYWGNAASNYAWAPVGPGMSLGINISIGSIPVNYWTYMPGRYMGYSNISRYYVPVAQNNVYIHNTTIINNYNTVNNNVRFARGPRTEDVSKFTGRPVNTVRVVPSNNVSNNGRISNGQMSVYRPGRSASTSNNGGGFSRGGNNTANNNGAQTGNSGFGRNNPANNNTNPDRANNMVNGTTNNNNGYNNPNQDRNNNSGNIYRRPDNNNNVNSGNNTPTGTNNPNNNSAPTRRWSNWNNRGTSGTASQPANNNQQNRQPAAGSNVPPKMVTPPSNTNREEGLQRVQQTAPPATTNRPAQTRNESFRGGRFSRGSNGKR